MATMRTLIAAALVLALSACVASRRPVNPGRCDRPDCRDTNTGG